MKAEGSGATTAATVLGSLTSENPNERSCLVAAIRSSAQGANSTTGNEGLPYRLITAGYHPADKPKKAPTSRASSRGLAIRSRDGANNYAYQLGDLSSVVLAHKDRGPKKYERWAEELFVKPYRKRKLKRPIFFWCKAWEEGARGPWIEFGPTSLTFLEYLLIGLASAEFPRLLNTEGTNRR